MLFKSQADRDRYWMREALDCARTALVAGEVPVGAVIIQQDELVSRGRNYTIQNHDPCAHAEIIALRKAGAHVQNYRLTGCELYVTLEPCIMCVAAMIEARIARLVFGAWEPKTGAAGSIVDLTNTPLLNHRLEVTSGIHRRRCAEIIQRFFARKR